MSRLIEVQDVEAVSDRLTLRQGDVLLFTASGGRIVDGENIVVQMVGPFQQGWIGPTGDILTPAGPPTAILFLMRDTGRAAIEVMTGDPWHNPRAVRLTIAVEK